MASDLSRTGPVERDIEQVYIYLSIFVLSISLEAFSLYCFEFHAGVLFAFRFCVSDWCACAVQWW